MRSGRFYDELLELNKNIYSLKSFKNYILIDKYADRTGLFVGLYQKDDQIFFVIKGTDVNLNTGVKVDFKNDYQLFKQQIPEQLKPAEVYFNKIKSKYNNVIITGYSLGGSLAQILGSKYGNETITYEAFAAGSIEKGPYDNIINFGNLKDPIFKADFKNHLGKIYIIPNKEESNIGNIWYHWYPNFGKPSTAIPCNKNIIIKSIYPTLKKVDDKKDEVEKYIKQGLIPDTKQIINSLDNKAKEITRNTYNKLKKAAQ